MYYLKHIRTSFTDHEIGQIAFQLIEKLEILHKNGIVYKFLSPKHVRVIYGFQINQAIKINLADITIMQLIDSAEHVPLEDKTCGMNKIFYAPEIFKKI